MKRRYALLVAIILIASSCGTESLTVEIQGDVTDASNNAPISDVLVVLGKSTGLASATELATTFTDGNGSYHLKFTFKPKEDCQMLFLDFERQGYLSKHISWASTPPLSCVESVQTVDVKLEKSSQD